MGSLLPVEQTIKLAILKNKGPKQKHYLITISNYREKERITKQCAI